MTGYRSFPLFAGRRVLQGLTATRGSWDLMLWGWRSSIPRVLTAEGLRTSERVTKLEGCGKI